MLLDGLTLPDESVVGGGQTALDKLAHDGAAELGVQPGDGARHEAVGNHCCGGCCCCRSIERRLSLVLKRATSKWCDVESDEVSLRAFELG